MNQYSVLTNRTTRSKRRFKKNRKIILEAAKVVFSQKGFENTTMADIADASEMASGTLYLYFRGKEELFYAVVQDGMQKLMKELSVAVSREKNAFNQLRLFVEVPCRFFEENQEIYKIYLRELPSCGGEGVSKNKKRCLIEGHQEYVNLLQGCLKKLIKPTVAVDYPFREAAFVIKGAVDSMIFNYMLEENLKPLTHQIDFLVEFFTRGLPKFSRKR